MLLFLLLNKLSFIHKPKSFNGHLGCLVRDCLISLDFIQLYWIDGMLFSLNHFKANKKVIKTHS